MVIVPVLLADSEDEENYKHASMEVSAEPGPSNSRTSEIGPGREIGKFALSFRFHIIS